MGEVRKVIIDGEEFDVDIEIEGDTYRATIEGQTFEFQIPDSIFRISPESGIWKG